ncbi:MAG: hypothetical protein IJ219_05035 [Bacteroidaceae bacterium]|nr:hypothetical protein [Bacteroidaceae bacterium]MBQ9294277.1 hypothetical protein [Bacteroidaceae bacterium]
MNNEAFTWLQPGAWQRRLNPDLFRMHRQTAVCGLPFTSMGNHFLLEWPDRQLVEVSRSSTEERFYKPGGVYFDACSKGKLLLLKPEEQAFVHPDVRRAAEEALRRKAEAKHLDYADLPVESRRYRFMALNEMGRMMVDAGRKGRG